MALGPSQPSHVAACSSIFMWWYEWPQRGQGTKLAAPGAAVRRWEGLPLGLARQDFHKRRLGGAFLGKI